MPVLLPAERTVLLVTLALAAVCLFLAWDKGITVELGAYWYSALFAAAMIGIGQFYRRVRHSERIALTAHIVGLFVAYSVPAALFNLLLLPRPGQPIDAALVRLDALFGYSWPAACAWVAQYPLLCALLRFIYSQTLVQFLLGFLLLGMLGDRRRLHVAALAAVFASLATVFSWALFPSSGASSYWTLAPEIDRVVRPTVDSAYGAALNRLLAEGFHDVAQVNTTGVVGFPSFHTVMGLLSLIAVWPYRPLRYAFLLLDLLLLPAILIDGGHNLMDVFGGAAITVLAWRLAAAADRAQAQSGPKLENAWHA